MSKLEELKNLIEEYLKCSDEIDRVVAGKSDGDLIELEKKLKSIYNNLIFKTNK